MAEVEDVQLRRIQRELQSSIKPEPFFGVVWLLNKMITKTGCRFYYVYPSWAKFDWKWEGLAEIFTNPYQTGFLHVHEKLEEIGYVPGVDKFELIDGPIGNGIIKSMENSKSKFFWQAVMIRDVNFMPLRGLCKPGCPVSVLEYGVCWLDEKSKAEHKVGIKNKFPIYVPKLTLDYTGCPDSEVYVSLSFRAGKVDGKICRNFEAYCRYFGFECYNEESKHFELPVEASRLNSPLVSQVWFLLKNVQNDLGLLLAKMFYVACAVKEQAGRPFEFIHLLGNFEGTPAMSKSLRIRVGKEFRHVYA